MTGEGEVWEWGELFSLRVPAGLAVRDHEHAVEFVSAIDGAPDEREGARAWLSVMTHTGVPPAEALTAAICRFAATVEVDMAVDAVSLVDRDGAVWGRVDFHTPQGDGWQVIGVAWNEQTALFLVMDALRDLAFASRMDQLIASWRSLQPLVVSSPGLGPEDDF